MNRRLTDFQIRSTCRALLKSGRSISGRQLRRALLQRFGAVGKTERVFQIWRETMAEKARAALIGALPLGVAELQRRLAEAQSQAAANLKRAELAEFREQAHQDHWAIEIDRVKRELEEARNQISIEQGRASRPFPV